MSSVSIATGTGFDARDFWIQNLGLADNVTFTGHTDTVGSLLTGHQTDTYDVLSIEADGLTYNYTGSWDVDTQVGLLNGTLTAGGSYDSIEVMGATMSSRHGRAPRSTSISVRWWGRVWSAL